MCRDVLFATCRTLRDAVRADAHLWPTVVLRAPRPTLVEQEDVLDYGYARQ